MQRELYRGGTTVIRGEETRGATVQHGAVISELGASSRGFCSPRYGRDDAWGRARRLGGGFSDRSAAKTVGKALMISRDRFRSEDSGITRHTFTRERRASSRPSARRNRRGRVPHQNVRPRKRNGR